MGVGRGFATLRLGRVIPAELFSLRWLRSSRVQREQRCGVVVTSDWTPEPATSRLSHRPGGGRRVVVDGGRLWAGGLATAVVAALIAIVGIVIARGIFHVPVLAPNRSGTWGDADTVTYALVAFGFGLLATALMHVLLLATPSPFTFFGWILGLSTLVAALAPFATSAEMASKVSTALINAVIGIGVWSLTVSTARRSLRRADSFGAAESPTY